jgi:hypothetical protein
MHQFWARLPGTMRVYHADDAAGLASQIRAATAGTADLPDSGLPPSTCVGDLK